MLIKRLLITDFRNLEYVDITPALGFNFICGPNGSGKTSLIEAIYYLALARSFRTNSYQYLVRHGQTRFNLYALVQEDGMEIPTSIGIMRERGTDALIKLNSEQITRLTDLVDHICVQLLHLQGVEQLIASPEERRSFLDWGVYYSVPEFKSLWLQYRRILRQRNALLRTLSLPARGHSTRGSSASFLYSSDSKDTGAESASQIALEQLPVWDEMLSKLSEEISEQRRSYLEQLQEILQGILREFLPDFKIRFELNFGWEKGKDLQQLLAQNLEKDRVLGYTFYGCHRADVKIKSNNLAAGATLSRGQLKMLVYAMRLAQGMLLKQQTGRTCIYLIDDLNSELDDHSQRVLLQTLMQCQHQVFVSDIKALRPDFFPPNDSSDSRVFNLNAGQLST